MPNPLRPFAGLERVDFTGLRMRLIDAEQQVIGRLAAHLAVLLQGKDKPIFAPHKDLGDVCVVVNAEKAVFTGNKWEGKLYKWHTGYPGGIKQMSAKEIWRRDPTELLRRAVYGMLPSNNLRDARMRKLRVFPGPEHPFRGVELLPWTPPPRQLQDKGLGWLVPDGFEPMNPAAYVKRMRGSRLVQQQTRQQQLVGGTTAAAAAAAAGGVPLVGQGQAAAANKAAAAAAAAARVVTFDDLLTAEEKAFIAAQKSS